MADEVGQESESTFLWTGQHPTLATMRNLIRRMHESCAGLVHSLHLGTDSQIQIALVGLAVSQSNDFFLVKFANMEDGAVAIRDGPWTPLMHYIIIRECVPNFNKAKLQFGLELLLSQWDTIMKRV
ncbi:hypothetical protein CRG98_004368 [Punica granatum]|uniref:DUF4283 domain-containing protein n=1 Tax=Punica granatum TaxID=22663 RepID=A0A2I0L3D6_PUNGR|nr:hypothetical protein CRG98_004368 [Punica granatum]